MSDAEAQNPKSGGVSPLLLLFSLGTVAVVLIAVALMFINQGGDAPDAADDAGVAIVEAGEQSTGVTQVEPKAVADFSLTRADGEALTLADLKGRYSLIYFGYTYCPDFCPSTMVDWRLISRALGQEAERLNFVMISVDPDRDTPEILTRYLQPFGEHIIGATGDEATLRSMADDFAAFYEPVSADDTPLYMVNHTASQFVLSPEGEYVTAYSFATPVDVIVADLRAKLAQ